MTGDESRYEDHGGRCFHCGRFLAANGYVCDGCDELEVDDE